MNRRSSFNVIGGIITAGHSFIAEKGENRSDMLIVGAAEAGAGILLASFTAKKRYYFGNELGQDKPNN